MNKQSTIFFIICGVIIVMVISFGIKEHVEKNKLLQPEFKPSLKESNVKGNFIEHLDSITLIYTNFKYGISIDFPDNWTTDKGINKYSLIRGTQKDSLISCEITVVELNNVSKNITIWDVLDNKTVGLEQQYHDIITKLVNTNIYNYKVRKVYVSNQKAIETKFSFQLKGVDFEYEIQGIFYNIYVIPNSYSIMLYVPKIFYDLNPNRYNYFINRVLISVPNNQMLN